MGDDKKLARGRVDRAILEGLEQYSHWCATNKEIASRMEPNARKWKLLNTISAMLDNVETPHEGEEVVRTIATTRPPRPVDARALAPTVCFSCEKGENTHEDDRVILHLWLPSAFIATEDLKGRVILPDGSAIFMACSPVCTVRTLGGLIAVLGPYAAQQQGIEAQAAAAARNGRLS